jgi:hypothetical protein
VSTFIIVTFAWVFFRQNDFHLAIDFCKRIYMNAKEFPEQFKQFPEIDPSFYWIIPLILFDWINRKNERQFLVPKNIILRWTLYVLMIFLVFLFSNRDTPFIYFQF